MPNSERIAGLIIRSIREEITAAERAELNAWMAESETNRKTAESFLDPEKRDQGIRDHWVEEKIWARLDKAITEESGYIPVVRRRWIKWVAAAAVILLAGTYFFLNKHQSAVQVKDVMAQIHDVSPGSNKAVLTLANGSKIILDSAQNGILAKQSGSVITKTDSGQLSYTLVNKSSGKSETLNTIEENILTTPRGGQYQLVLPDGTKVWLNAASSITYPTAFIGKERRVTITGEVYFEVIHNERQPFSVTANGTEIQDIGTQFNINAYADESGIKTTLLKGSVRLIENKNKIILKPVQQGITGIQGNNQIQVTSDIDIEKIMAWKNGWFEFDQTDLSVIMRQISRWYNVDVTFEGSGRGQKFFGRISKDVPLSNILQSLEANSKGVKFKLEGTKLIVQQ